MALEIGFVDRDVLDRNQFRVADELQHTVDHQERITVGQHLEDALDIERRLTRLRGPGGGGLLLRTLLPFLQLLKEDLRELGVDRMAGARGDDVRLERHAEQENVADDIEDLVADELVLEAQRLLRDDLVALDDDGAVE